MSSAVGQMVNFMGTLQNEWAGAQAFSSVDTYLAPYVRNDKLTYEQVEQSMQELIYNLNVPSRWGSQISIRLLPVWNRIIRTAIWAKKWQ